MRKPNPNRTALIAAALNFLAALIRLLDKHSGGGSSGLF
jgi:hypothetical protein